MVLGSSPMTGISLWLAVATTARAESQQISTCLLSGSMSTMRRSPKKLSTLNFLASAWAAALARQPSRLVSILINWAVMSRFMVRSLIGLKADVHERPPL
ncbi:hypothetical protein D3C81_1099490 [compost metagenome]